MAIKKVKITTDSTVDFTPEIVEKYDITVMPLYIVTDEGEYRDTLDITPDDVYAYYDKYGKTATSSACNLDAYSQKFKELTDEGYAVVHIGLSSELSSSFNNARMAAMEFEDVYVVDSLNLSTGIGLLVLKAAEMAKEGMEAKEIAEKVSAIVPNVDVSFILDTLDYLHAGGRCSAVAKFGANLLKLKPSIAVKEGKMGVDKKYRGNIVDRRVDYIKDSLHTPENIDKTRAFITHSGGFDDAEIENLVKVAKETIGFEEVLVTRAGCVISAHCGPGCVGILFIREK